LQRRYGVVSVASKRASALGAVACLMVGCTGILYGSSETSNDNEAVSSGAAVNGGSSTSPEVEPAPSGGAEHTSGGGECDCFSAGGVVEGGATSAGAGGVPLLAGGNASVGGSGEAGQAGSPSESGGAAGASEGGSAGSTGGAEPVAGSGSGGEQPAEPLLPGDKARGYKLVVLNNCYRCHGSDLSGRAFYRNITPDLTTGVGAWTDEQLAMAIVAGVNPEGELLCATMPVYSGLTDQGLADMIAFLRSIPPRLNEVSEVCPGHDP
jgi:cytochrome c553